MRLVHPFPSFLDAAVAGVLVMVAGGPIERASVAAAGMLALQFSIGALNDVHDREHDARAKPAKPIPAGLVPIRLGWAVVAVGATIGIVLSAMLGPGTLIVGLAGYGCGMLYDLRLKGTAWSWVAFALGVPLIPVYAWTAAAVGMPAAFLLLVPLAFVSGAGLAVANSAADVEVDRQSGTSSVAAALGERAAALVAGVLQAGVVVVALATLAATGGGGPAWIVAVLGSIILLVGLLVGASGSAALRRHAWEVQAVGTGLLAAGWLTGVVGAP